jgi:hypothetical protein
MTAEDSTVGSVREALWNGMKRSLAPVGRLRYKSFSDAGEIPRFRWSLGTEILRRISG